MMNIYIINYYVLSVIIIFLWCIEFIKCHNDTNLNDYHNNNNANNTNNITNTTKITNITNNISNYNKENYSNMKKLSRRKRYAAFPEGSTLAVSFCETIGVFGDPQYIYISWAINWGVAYDLPNETWIVSQNYKRIKVPKAVMLRRHRRELYRKLEVVMTNMGFNGRECILRALCESSQYFYRKGSNMAAELLRTIFSLPKSKVLSFEHNDLLAYDTAHRKGHNRVYCPLLYPDCSFSLIELALGEYSKPFNYM